MLKVAVLIPKLTPGVAFTSRNMMVSVASMSWSLKIVTWKFVVLLSPSVQLSVPLVAA